MTNKQIKTALEEVYQEMTSWRDVNKRLGYKIPQDEVSRRGLFFIAREELCRLDDAKKSGDERAESLHQEIYELVKTTLALY